MREVEKKPVLGGNRITTVAYEPLTIVCLVNLSRPEDVSVASVLRMSQ